MIPFDPHNHSLTNADFQLKNKKVHRLTVPADTKYLTKIRDFAVKHGEKKGLNMRQLNGFKLSLDEICTNIIRYAYKDREQGNIQIEIFREADDVNTRIIDTGVAFDYESVMDPDLNRYIKEKKKGGFGIYLVRQLNDNVQYKREGEKNILTLTNRVEPRPRLGEVIKKNFTPSRMTIKVRFGVIATLIISLISVGTFYLASLSQKRTLTRQLVSGYVNILKNFAGTTADYIMSERELLITEQIFGFIEENEFVRTLTVIDRNGIVIADGTVQNIGRAYEPPDGVVPLMDQDFLVQEYEDPENGPSLHFSVPIMFSNAFVGKSFLTVHTEDLTAEVQARQNRLRIFLYMSMFWIAGFVGIIFLSNMFVTPIKKITEELNRVSKEGAAGGFHFAGIGEFGEISTAFNRMMKELKQSEVKLTDQVRLKREMQLAQSIQQTLLPKTVPPTEGFDIAAKYDAAMEVGGDYYDFFYVDDDSMGMAVGDVSGKGIGGAFVMSIVRTALRLEARAKKSAAEVLTNINTTLDSEFRKGMYITLFYIILDSKRRLINYASAGHNPMVLYRKKTDQIYNLNPKGFPIGLNLGDPRIFKRSVVNEKLQLSKGDLLFVYTDGITEAMNGARDEFGEERLLEVIKRYNDLSAGEFAEKLMDELHLFTGGQPQNDDITFIVVKEKKQYSELQYEKRIRLFDLIENEGYTVKNACEEMGISTSTYYKLRKIREEGGTAALVPKTGLSEMKVLDHDISRRILQVIRDHPEFSAKRIRDALTDTEYGSIDVDSTLVYRELKRLKLSNREKREAYVRRLNGHQKES